MKKKYLFLGLALLLCGGSAWAQTDAPTTKDIASFDQLSAAINGINNAANLKTEIAQLEQRIITYEDNLNATTQYVTTIKKTSDVHNALASYYSTINTPSGQTITDETEISYALGIFTEDVYNEETWEMETVKTYTLYITIPNVSNKITSATNSEKKIQTWKTVKAKDVYTIKYGNDINKKKELAFWDATKQVYPDKVVIVYAQKNTGSNIIFDTPVDISDKSTQKRFAMFTPDLLLMCVNRSETLLANNNDYTTTEEVPQTDANGDPIETTDYKNKKQILKNAQKELDEKKATLGDFASITTLNITNDITVPVINALATQTWPAGYTIKGNYHTVSGTDTGNNPLFNANNGTIYNLVAVNGRIAKTNNGNVDNCIVKTAEGYRVYSENAYTNAGADIKDAVYQKRDIFGYDLTNLKVGQVNDNNKLYKASYASAANKTKQLFYVNIDNASQIIDGNNLVNYPTENAFIYVEDNNVPAIETENVVANGVCKNAVIVDGLKQVGEKMVNTAEFYIPTDFKVENLKYARNLKTDVATVCMPFAFTEDVKAQINNKLTNGNEVYYYSLREINQSTQTIWFGYKSNINANEPAVLAFTKDCVPGNIFDGLTNLEFKSTEGATLGLAATNDVNDTKKRFRGNYKANQTTDDLAETAAAYEPGVGAGIFGFNNGQLVEMNKDKGRMHQFRSFVVFQTDLTRPNEISAFRVGFMDEEGNEVTHIKNVNTDRNENSEFKVSGSNGSIEISAEKACDVKVYTTGGALVKAVRVEAGQTSLPVNAGMYIVNKNKVVVK